MITQAFCRLRRVACLLVAVLAIATQLSAVAALNQAAAASRAGLAARALEQATVMCQAGKPGKPGQPTPLHHHHAADQGVLAILAGSSQAITLPHSTFLAPRPERVPVTRPIVYSARAPPGLAQPAPYPRGPPAFV